MDEIRILHDDRAVTEGVLNWFSLLSSVPHGSGNEGPLADLLVAECGRRGWAVERDPWNNLKIDLPAAPGLEHLPPLAFQGHLDMVCAVADGSGWDPLSQPITWLVEDGVLRTDGRSSLGADNNLGNAAVLWLLDKPLTRGPVRVILTTAEEVGLLGAGKLNPAWLDGCRYLINTDGFCFGRAVISSAGGRRETFTRPLTTVPCEGGAAFRLSLSGFLGGHSGADIHRDRGNAVKLLAHFLSALRLKTDYRLAHLEGGHAHNAIPMSAHALLVTSDPDGLRRAAEEYSAVLARRYGRSDPGCKLELTAAPLPETVWSEDSRDDTLDFLLMLHDGIFSMHDQVEDTVADSSNVGLVKVENGAIQVGAFPRCTRTFSEEILADRHLRAAARTGFGLEVVSYPGWEGSADNPLALRMADVLRRQTGRELEITAVHVGLEPSFLGEKNPALTMVVCGPEIRNPHSTDEHAPLNTLPDYVRLLAGTMEDLPKP